jgi:hypothetical protein
MVLVTDVKMIEALVRAGKYREHLPFWTRYGDALWIAKPAPIDSTGNRSVVE